MGKIDTTYSECPRYRIKTNVHFVHKVCRVADTHEGATRVDVVLPSVEFLVALERKVHTLVFGFKQEAVRLEVRALDVGDVGQCNECLNGRILGGQ